MTLWTPEDVMVCMLSDIVIFSMKYQMMSMTMHN